MSVSLMDGDEFIILQVIGQLWENLTGETSEEEEEAKESEEPEEEEQVKLMSRFRNFLRRETLTHSNNNNCDCGPTANRNRRRRKDRLKGNYEGRIPEIRISERVPIKTVDLSSTSSSSSRVNFPCHVDAHVDYPPLCTQSTQILHPKAGIELNGKCEWKCEQEEEDKGNKGKWDNERRHHHHHRSRHRHRLFLLLLTVISLIPGNSAAFSHSSAFPFSFPLLRTFTSDSNNNNINSNNNNNINGGGSGSNNNSGGRHYVNVIKSDESWQSAVLAGLRTHCTREKYSQHPHNPNHTIAGTIKCVLNAPQNSSATISRRIIAEISGNLTFKSSSRSPVALDVTCEKVLDLDGTLSNTNPLEGRAVFDFSEVSDFLPNLQSISITGCNLTDKGLLGSLPRRLRRLDLSNNSLESLSEKLFSGNRKWVLSSVNLSNNENLRSLPKSLLSLSSVEKVWINRHNMTCPWVATHLYQWHEKKVLMEPEKSESECRSDSEKSIPLTLYGALRAKHDETAQCNKLDVNCTCSIYTIQYTDTLQRTNFPVSFQSHKRNVSITLKIDCSNRGLKRLPRISPHTKVLNVSHNQITNLDELRLPEYKNLGTLDAEFNHIDNIDSVQGTSFVGHFDALGLSHNNISVLTHRLMTVLLDSEVKGHGRISLGENFILCDCDTAKFVKPLLAKHQKRIADAKRLFCRNEEPFIKVQELELQKVCELDEENEQNFKWYIIIAVEVLLILMILLKVGHDSRQYRTTGILPWCSSKMPRLPCDFMLEGIKDPRPNGR